MNKPLQNIEELIAASIDNRTTRQRYSIPHPLNRFRLNGKVKENVYADAILQFVNSWVFTEPDSMAHRVATWFLFESEMAFYFVCSECGINAEKLRGHLQVCRQRQAYRKLGTDS